MMAQGTIQGCLRHAEGSCHSTTTFTKIQQAAGMSNLVGRELAPAPEFHAFPHDVGASFLNAFDKKCVLGCDNALKQMCEHSSVIAEPLRIDLFPQAPDVDTPFRQLRQGREELGHRRRKSIKTSDGEYVTCLQGAE